MLPSDEHVYLDRCETLAAYRCREPVVAPGWPREKD